MSARAVIDIYEMEVHSIRSLTMEPGASDPTGVLLCGFCIISPLSLALCADLAT